MQVIKLEFGGYKLNAEGLSPKSGIYCVYSCTYNKNTDTVSIDKLLYIGESGDIRGRVMTHNHKDDWDKQLKKGQVLCYSYAFITNEDDRKQAEAALIYQHKPPVNSDHTEHFNYDDVCMKLKGRTALLDREFIVLKTN